MKYSFRTIFAVLIVIVLAITTACVGSDPTTLQSKNSEVSNPEETEMQIPEFFNFYFELRDKTYDIALSEDGENWVDIQPYAIRVNNNITQNVKIGEPVQMSPLIYFDMGDKPVTIRITKNEKKITKATTHPVSYGIKSEVISDTAVITIDKPANFCVRINEERYDLVYIMANPLDKDVPKEGDKGVKIIKPGLTIAPRVGSEVWSGGIRDVRIYDRALSADEVTKLSKGENVSDYSNRWALDENMLNEKNASHTPVLYGEPKVVSNYKDSKGALVFNGYEDSVSTGYVLQTEKPQYTISTWAYLEPEAAGAHRVIINHMLFVRSDGTVGSNIGDWQFPYYTDNKFTPGEWHNVILTKNENEVTIYIDGVSGGTKTRMNEELDIHVGIGSGTLINAIYLRDNETLYVSPGAVIRGTVVIYGSENVTLRGRGIIDITPNNTVHSYTGIICAFSNNVSIEGVIVNNPSSFNLALGQSQNIKIKNFKCFSSYGASDGINTKASKNIMIEDCFLRPNDDTISIYATSVTYLGSTQNLTVKNSALISDAGHIVNSGIHAQEHGEDTISDILITDVDIIDSKSPYTEYQGVLAVNAGNDNVTKKFEFSNIRIEDFRMNQLFNLRVTYNGGYNKTPGRSVEDIVFKNITYNGQNSVPSIISGYNSTRKVRNILFENIMINGKKMEEGDGTILNQGFAENIVIK